MLQRQRRQAATRGSQHGVGVLLVGMDVEQEAEQEVRPGGECQLGNFLIFTRSSTTQRAEEAGPTSRRSHRRAAGPHPPSPLAVATADYKEPVIEGRHVRSCQ